MKNKYEIRGNRVAIFLDRKDGSVVETIIDKSDFEKVSQFPNKWYADYCKDTNSFYVKSSITKNNKKVCIRLHRFLLDTPSNLQVDHKNYDTLNNTRKNIRNVSACENRQNQKIRSNNKSGYRGIYWYKRYGKWKADIQVNGKRESVGYFSDLELAVSSVRSARLKNMPYYIDESDKTI